MVLTVEQGDLQVDQRITGEHTVLHRVLRTGIHRRDVLARDTTAGDSIVELVGGAVFGVHQRLELDDDLGELPRSTGLLLVGVLVLVDGAADGLAVGDLGLAHIRLDLELPLHPVDQDVEVKLTHTADDGLAGLLVELHRERRVLFGELLDRGTELLLVGLGLRLDRDVDDRVREAHRLQHDGRARIAQGVTGGGVLEADHRVDVARSRILDRVLLVGMHLEELADAFLLALGGVEHLGAGVDLARVDADEGQLAEERVSRDLERERRERLVGRRLAREDLLLVADGVTLDRGDVERRRQVIDDRVQHRLNTLVLERGAADHRVVLPRDRQLADGALDLLGGELLATEVLLQQCLVGLGDGLEQLLAVLGGLVGQIRGDLLEGRGSTDLDGATPGDGLLLDQVDDAVEVVLRTDGQLQDQRLGAQTILDGLDGEEEVGTELVHLVDEADARDVVLLGLSPDLLGLRLDAFLAVEDGHGTVEHAQAALHLDGEVDVPGSVDDVDLVLVPEAGHRRGGDGDTPLLLLLHPVGGRGTVVGLTDLVVHTGVEEDPLGGGRLAGIDVGHDADVANLVQVAEHFLCHQVPFGK